MFRTFAGPCLLFALALTIGCEEEPGVVRLRVIGAFEPAEINFGEVPIGMTRQESVILRNTGAPIMTIDTVVVPPGYGLTGVKGRLEGTEIVPGAELALEVVFIPTEVLDYSGQIVVKSGTTDIPLTVRGSGVRKNIPLLALEPASLEFGSVAIGTQARRSFVVHNTGTAPGVLDRATLGSTSMDVRASDTYALAATLPITVPVAGSTTIEAVFAPTTEGAHADTITISASGEHAPLVLTLNGTGLIPAGDILCTPSTVGFGSVERGQSALRDVTCTAQGGPARFISATIAGSTMFVLPSPPSTRALAAGESITMRVEFHADGLPMPISGDLVVSYDGGGGGARTVTVELNATVTPPPPSATAMTVVMRWDRNNTDVDLHLVRPGGSFYAGDGSDCHWRQLNPEWGAPGVTTDNPFLDVDDIDGMGPETINLESAAPGNYQVHVHYFGSILPLQIDAELEIYIAGTRVATPNRTNMACDQVWYAGDIQWNGTTGTYMPRNTVSVSGEGSCF